MSALEARPPVSRSTNCFDFLRLFAAVAVVIGHSTHYLQTSFLWLDPDSRLWFRDGVVLFFVVSGFLVFRSAERCVVASRPVWHFYANRFLRVAPAIYVYLILVAPLLFIVGVAMWGELRTAPFWAWWGSTAALVPVYHPDAWRSSGTGVVNGALWTIPVESSFYVIAPFLALSAIRFGFARMMGLLATVSVLGLTAAYFLDVPRSEMIYAKLLGISFFPYLIYFAVGILWSRMWVRVPHSIWWALSAALIYAGARGLFSAPNEQGGFLAYAGVLVWIIPFSYAVMWFGNYGPRFLSRLTERIGDLSFGVYIWHMVVVNAVLLYELDRYVSVAPNPVVHLLVLAAALILAVASWRFVERPSLRLKPFTSRTENNIAIQSAVSQEDRVAFPRNGKVRTPIGSEGRV